MNELQSNIQNYNKDLNTFIRNSQIQKLYFFGYVCTTNFKNSSDIDLIVELKPMQPLEEGEYILKLRNNFEEIFKRKVDLLTTNQEIRNPIFKNNIERTKQLFYTQD